MYSMWKLFLLAISIANIKADVDIIEPHAHSKIKIVGYNGPLNKDVLTLFKGVEKLHFKDCNITSAPAHLFSQLPYLKSLHLENNVIAGIEHSDVLKGALRLESIRFINNTVDQIVFSTIHGLPELKEMINQGLQNPQKVIPSLAFQNTKLEVFDFSNNGLETVENWAFNGSDRLRVLKLNDNKLKTLSKEALTSLTSLQTLELSGNQLESFSADQLPDLPNLDHIDISRNPLTKLNLDGIEKVAPKLKTLVLIGTPIPESEFKKLAAKSKFNIVTKPIEL